ncbi:hypothetical protein L210DRAFT_968463 [Boletus edulis BED1]|uniref:Rhodopsin domain-containing protein n=1 Tax=Boletus edulis BED1 TaxID=1328754 RepID=A0AAD4BN31_BOLED|nr:hypothetical protein L210DRAFT_968463 [Boletus edulis BED1]
MFPNWSCVAILSTLFRLWYRWYTARIWWDDGWAMLAFLAEIAWLVTAIIEQPVSDASIPRLFYAGNWIVSFAYPTLMWATRISILTSVVRVSRPEGMLRHIALSIGVLFGLLGIAMLGLRLRLCLTMKCLMTRTILIVQTTTDGIADVLLSALPIWFLRSLKLSRKRKILVSSALSASMVINIVTVIETVAFFQSVTSGTIIFEHVKVACSMIVCNLLVIVTFVYRVLRKDRLGLEDSIPETRNRIEFTTIDFAQGGLSEETSKGMPSSALTTGSSTWSFRATLEDEHSQTGHLKQ